MTEPTRFVIEEPEEDRSFYQWYGPWEHLRPQQVRELFDGVGIDWWVFGGYAIEAFTGVPREHEDIDVSIFAKDLPTLRDALTGKYHLWSNEAGMLRPISDRYPDPIPDSNQIWVREHALAPWCMDLGINPDKDGQWVSRRDLDCSAPLDDVTFVRDGIRYLNPEVALCFKATQARPKDNRDLAVALPLMDESARAWLADYLARKLPEHPWRERD